MEDDSVPNNSRLRSENAPVKLQGRTGDPGVSSSRQDVSDAKIVTALHNFSSFEAGHPLPGVPLRLKTLLTPIVSQSRAQRRESGSLPLNHYLWHTQRQFLTPLRYACLLPWLYDICITRRHRNRCNRRILLFVDESVICVNSLKLSPILEYASAMAHLARFGILGVRFQDRCCLPVSSTCY